MSALVGLVFDIQKFSLHDGDGIRTVVFMKGCQMKCPWCHNPESLSSQKQLKFDADKCQQCQQCAQVCPNDVHHFDESMNHIVDFKNCQACGLCVEACPHGALSLYGKEMSVDDVFAEILKDKVYFETSGGGVTLSGGEALKQFKFSLALAKKCQEHNINVCLETNGASKQEYYAQIMPYIDTFLFDYKATGATTHKKLTGIDERQVRSNLNYLNEAGAKIVLRCPIIPQYNLSDDHLKSIADLAQSLKNIIRVEVLPYHNFGKGKAAKIGKHFEVDIEMPNHLEQEAWIAKIKQHGTINVTLMK